MNEALMLTFAAAVPFLCLGLLLWLARLEDTLTDGLESPASRQSLLEPAPVPATAPATEPVGPVASAAPAAPGHATAAA